MQRTWELAMTGRFHSCAEVLAQLEREGLEDIGHWLGAVHTHRKIDEVCRASVAALANGRPESHRAAASEDEAIWAVMLAEIAAFWMRDFEAYAACFVQSPRFRFHAGVMPLGVTIREGLEAFARAVRADILQDPLPNPFIAFCGQIENRNLSIVGDMAWCTFTARFPTLDLKGFHGPGLTEETRVLERHDGRWMIAYCAIHSINFGQTTAPLWEIDRGGVVVQQNPAASLYLTQADDVVIRAGRLMMREHGADHKLAKAVAALLDTDHYFMTGRSALPVVIDAGYDLPRTVWWVIAEHGKLMVSYNDHPQLLARLQTAGKVFALSPAQSRLATALVEGLPLTDAARREAVSIGTAKTQLQRIFDKVGVRNQPALVRALLAVT